MDKFTQVYNEFYLHEINRPIIKSNYILFNDLAKKLILEDYYIFPVPKLLLDDIELFAKNNFMKLFDKEITSIIKKEYFFKDLLKNYTNGWNYYHDFVKNVQELYKLKKDGKIICCLISNDDQIKNVISTYDLDVTVDQIKNSKACAFSCHNTKNFDVCLCINVTKGKESLRKCIQHELIHWMQVALNMYTKTSRGIFNSKKFDLQDNDIKDLSNELNMSKNDFIQTYQYLLDGYQFEAWVANTCEEFEKSNLSIEEFCKATKSNENFLDMFYSTTDQNQQQMFLFGRICYLSSLNDKSDDRYWYLIEALKENKVI